MKQKLKLLIFLFTLTTIISCLQDDDIHQSEEHGEIIPSPKSEISFKDFLGKFGSNLELKSMEGTQSLGNLPFGKPKNQYNKSNEQSIIHYIDTTTIVAFEFDYIQTYTFNVVPTEELENTFYNIIFYENQEGVQHKLLKYESNYAINEEDTTSFSGTIYEIEENGTIVNTYTETLQNAEVENKSFIVTCAFSVSVVDVTCTGLNHNGYPENHTVNHDCNCGVSSNCSPPSYYVAIDLDCPTEMSGGGSSTVGNDGNTNTDGSNPDGNIGGGSSSGDTSDPNQNDDGTFNLPTDPVRPVKIIVQELTSVEKLKKITNVIDIKNKLYEMRVGGGFFEKGLKIKNYPQAESYVASPILSQNNGVNHIRIPVDQYTEVIAHTHPDGYMYKMYAGNDIIKMGQMVQKVNSLSPKAVNPEDVTHILIADNRTFALRFDDLESALKLKDIYANKKLTKAFKKKLNDKYDSDNTGHPLNQSTTTIYKQMDHMFDLFQDYGLNMSLFEASYNSSGRISTWEEIVNN